MKNLFMFIVALMLFSVPAIAGPVQDAQAKIGTDKIAHVAAGATCSFFLADRIFDGKKHRKAISFAICSALALAKEQTDTKSDPKDLAATEIGIFIALIEF